MDLSETLPFAVYTLENDRLRLQLVPELGARIVSLQSVSAGKEWMWWPGRELKLFRNQLGDPFELSPLAGADECVPTVAPCVWQGRALPDHGEVWSAPWCVTASRDGRYIETECEGRVTPFRLRRRIELVSSELVFSYRIDNLSPLAERFLWAFHPLFRVEAEAKLQLPPSVRQVLATSVSFAMRGNCLPWPECSLEDKILDFSSLQLGSGPAYAKLFADLSGLNEAWAAVVRGEERLLFRFSPSEVGYLGIWITRGGWHGYHHFALEPTVAPCDTLSDTPDSNHTLLPGQGSREWQFTIRLEANDSRTSL